MKPTVDVFIPLGHGVLFPDGPWMTAMPSGQFTGHDMDSRSYVLCPKTGYDFNPHQFWGSPTGYTVPDDQRNFGPPEGYPPSPKRRSEREDFEKYIEIRKEMRGVIAAFDDKHAALRTN